MLSPLSVHQVLSVGRWAVLISTGMLLPVFGQIGCSHVKGENFGSSGQKNSLQSKKERSELDQRPLTRIHTVLSGDEQIDKSLMLCIRKVSTSDQAPWCVNLFKVGHGTHPDYETCRGDENCLPAARSGDSIVGLLVAKRENSNWFVGHGKYAFTANCCDGEIQEQVVVNIDDAIKEVSVRTSVSQENAQETQISKIEVFVVATVEHANGMVELHRRWQKANDNKESGDRLRYEIVNGSDKSIYGVGGLNQFRMEMHELRGSEWYITEMESPDCDVWGNQLLPGEKTTATECFKRPGKEVVRDSNSDCLKVTLDYSHQKEPIGLDRNGKLISVSRRYRLVDYIENQPGACGDMGVNR